MSDLNNELWAVQAGDKLLIMDGSRLSVVTVDRVTPMQVVIQYDAFAVRYRKENGREVGATPYHGKYAYVWNDAARERWKSIKAKVARRNLALALDRLTWVDVAAAPVQAVAELLVEAEVGGDTLRNALAAVKDIDAQKEA